MSAATALKISEESFCNDVAGPENRADFLEYNFDSSPLMLIPGDWNGQDVSLTWYDGLTWFRRTIGIDELESGKQFLHVGAVNCQEIASVGGFSD